MYFAVDNVANTCMFFAVDNVANTCMSFAVDNVANTCMSFNAIRENKILTNFPNLQYIHVTMNTVLRYLD